MTGKITRNTMIAGEAVSAGTVVEVDDATYRQLRLCKKIEPLKRSADGAEEARKPDPPKFKRISPTAAAKTD